MRIDDTDREILKILLRNAETSKAELGRRIGIAASAIFERIKDLEESGLIRRYETRIDGRLLGIRTLAYVFITERKPTKGVDTGGLLSAVTGVEEVHKIAGEDCYLVKIRARDTEHLGQILDKEINPISTVTGVRTSIVLRTIKEDVPLGGAVSYFDSEDR